MEFDLVIRNANVATASDTFYCDIGIKSGVIQALGVGLPKGKEEIDAGGKYVLPGGIDAHCHFDQPMPDGVKMADDFVTGSHSAVIGGTTTLIPFALQLQGQNLMDAVECYHQKAAKGSYADYAFHVIVTDTKVDQFEANLKRLTAEGYRSYKIYMTYDDMKLEDSQILKVLYLNQQNGAMTMIHAENADIIEWLTQALEQKGHIAPKYHCDSRPQYVEREATHRAITLSEVLSAPILLVHVSGEEAIEQIRWAQSRGMPIHAETCPQYLFLTAEDLDKNGFEGAKCVCSPPPRDENSQQSVWNGLKTGVFDVFSSDHAPFRYTGSDGKQAFGCHAEFKYIPNGIPGVETRLSLLFSEGVLKKRLSINDFVYLTATGPAKMYGLYPKKGTISVGSDADLVIWDSEKVWKVTNEKLHHNVDYTPYEGMALTGFPSETLLRGQVVTRNGELVNSDRMNGEFIVCDCPEPLT